MNHNSIKVSLIAAIGKNRELGKNNKLLWNIPEDLKRFRDITRGHPIIMGRKTFESIGRVLPGRANIVITRNPVRSVQGKQELGIRNYENTENLIFVESLEEGIEVAKKSYSSSEASAESRSSNSSSLQGRTIITEDEIFIIGGGQIFEQAIGIADKLYLTIVEGDFEADTYFPEYSEFSSIAHQEKSSYNDLRYTFLDLTRTSTDS